MNSRCTTTILLAASMQGALAQDCVLLTCGPDDYCEVTPSRLTATLPPALEIRSIRGNTKIASRGEAAASNCRPMNRLPSVLSADEVSIFGSVQVAGNLQTAGVLRFEPNDGGELEFRPAKDAFQSFGRFFRTNFERIKLDEAQPPVTVVPPAALAKADCWEARATAELTDFSLLIGDTSAAGTYVRQARITKVGSFKKCIWGGE